MNICQGLIHPFLSLLSSQCCFFWDLLHERRVEEWQRNVVGRTNLFHQVINVQFEFIWMHSIMPLMLMAHGCEHQLCRSVIWLWFGPISSNIYGVKKRECIKIGVNRITLKFLSSWLVLFWIQRVLLSRFLCLLGQRGCRRNQTCHETFFILFFAYLLRWTHHSLTFMP